MRKFLESLFGTSKGQANMQDIRVSKECRLCLLYTSDAADE